MKYVYVCNPRGSIRKLPEQSAEAALKQPGWKLITDQALIDRGYIPEYDLGPHHPIAPVTPAKTTQPKGKERAAFTTVVV